MFAKDTRFHGQHVIIKYFLTVLFVFLSLSGFTGEKNGDLALYLLNPSEQPLRAWAERIEQPGLPNLHKVSDALYRGAQPTAQGFLVLQQMGIKTVINLRSAHSDAKMLKGTSLKYIEIPCRTWSVKEIDIIAFLKAANNPSNQPVFVHCEHGADRTGTMCAVYRVIVQGWSREEAADEMVNGGFGFHRIWKNLVKLILSLDVERIKNPSWVR